ncbi:MAG: hypothetical protein MHM6MM_005799 [Cercozoa sp. M6MM]
MVCVLVFACVCVVNVPKSLQKTLEKSMGMSSRFYGLFIACAQLPATVMSLLSGWLADRHGATKTASAFAVCICAGMLVSAVGAQSNLLVVLLVGRILQGLNSVRVGATETLVSFFKHNGLGLAMSFQRAANALGNVAAMSAPWVKLIIGSVPGMFWLFAALSSFAAAAAMMLHFLFGRYVCSNKLGAMKERLEMERLRRISEEDVQSPQLEDNMSLRTFASSVSSDLRSLPGIFWVLFCCALFMDVCVLGYMTFVVKLVAQKFHWPEGTASIFASIIKAVGVTSPLFGVVVDFLPRRELLILAAASTVAASHAILCFSGDYDGSATSESPSHAAGIVGLTLLGLGSNLYGTSVFPTIGRLCHKSRRGTAYGVVFGGTAFLASIISIVGAEIQHQGYNRAVEYMFLGMGGIAVVFSLLLVSSNARNLDVCNRDKNFLTELEESGLLDDNITSPAAVAAFAAHHPRRFVRQISRAHPSPALASTLLALPSVSRHIAQHPNEVEISIRVANSSEVRENDLGRETEPSLEESSSDSTMPPVDIE